MRKIVWVCAGLALVTVLAYGQVAGNQFLSFDDEIYVTGNLDVLQGLTAQGVKKVFSLEGSTYWHPLTMISHMTDVSLFGISPAGHHLMNLFLHLLATVLLFLALFRMTGRLWISAFAAALFALHPLNVETVAWVAQRKNILWGLFFSGGLLAWSWYARKPRLGPYLAVCAAFVLGLLSKPTMITFPFVLLLLDYWPLGRAGWGQSRGGLTAPAGAPASVGRLVAEKIPLFAIMALGLAAALYSNRQFGMDQGGDSALGLRLANAPVAYFIYLLKVVWPANLAVFYPMPASVPAWQTLASLTVLAAVTVLAVWQARRRPYLIVGWLWFCGTLFPMAGLLHTGLWPQWADRWSYIPAVGLFLAASFGLAEALAPRTGKKGLAVAAGVVLAALAVVTVMDLGHWKTDKTLFTRALEVTEDNYVAYNTLARIAAREKELDKASEYFQKALTLQPGYFQAYNDLGVALLNSGQAAEAAERFRQALTLKPDFFRALNNLGISLAQQEKFEEAVDVFEKALAVNPGYMEAQGNLAYCHARLGNLDQAIVHDEAALAINPGRLQSHVNLGDVYFLKGEMEKARDHYLTALAISPRIPRAHYELGRVLSQLGQDDEAAGHLEAAIELAPEKAYPEAYFELGQVLEKKGHIAEARDRYRDALRFDPEYAEAQVALDRLPDIRMAQAVAQMKEELEKNPENPVLLNRLGNLYKNQGNLALALETYQKALEVAPSSAAVLNNIGSVQMAQKEYDEARTWFEKAIQAAPQLIPAYYNMACLYSLKGEAAESAQWLQKAVALGFDSWDVVDVDPDLANLRGSVHYEELKAAARTGKAS